MPIGDLGIYLVRTAGSARGVLHAKHLKMRQATVATGLFIALVASVVAGKDAVLTGTGANFEEIVTKNDFVVAEFYASWCGKVTAPLVVYPRLQTDFPISLEN